MNIIEKFRAWKTQHPDEDYQLDEIHEFANSLDRGELLEVFEALDMPELDAPDSEGWWWFMYPDGQLFCVDIFKEDGKLFREERDGHVYLATSYNGKWMRAIVPKGFESEGEDGKK